MEAPDRPGYTSEDVRVEYQAVAQYTTTVATFRFTVLGFYLASVGFIAGRDASPSAGGLLIGITIAVWIMDLRNRALLANIGLRGIQIERDVWGFRGSRSYDGFFSRQLKVEPKDDEAAPPRPGPDTNRIAGLSLPFRIPGTSRRVGVMSYTLALNLLYVSVLAYSIWTIASAV